MAGIGCHFMSLWMDRSTAGFTQMGGEGVPWVGQQPFSHDQHIFANIGDGTYFHSGLLAVRQSIAAGVNITYKILYNDAVAMTGGQPVGERPEGHSVVQIALSMKAEGATKIVVVTDEPEKYNDVALAEGVTVEHRDRLDAVQRQLRDIKACTVIIYDQTCATEKRRRRKRGAMVDPAQRVVINDLVCEGCGDCSVQSNCLSVEPLETEYGRKRQINQSTCNKDMSCVKGFCPSFVTVEGGTLKKAFKSGGGKALSPYDMGALPEPAFAPTHATANGVWGMVVCGVGGTGVITIGQLLGVAAHLEGKGIVTQDAGGLAQKGGATWSYVLIGGHQDDIRTTRVGAAGADLVIGCDPIVAVAKETLLRMRQGRTHVAINSSSTPTAAFVKDGNWQNPSAQCVAEVADIVGAGLVSAFDADSTATRLMGDSIYTNPLMMGYAWQKGWIPLEKASILRAIELNAVAVQQNKLAFEWGCCAAHDPVAVQKLLAPLNVIEFKKRENLADAIARRVEFLTAYQNAAYAAQYQAFVHKVQACEKALGGKSLPLAEAVARYLFKLMAYKDEYEVARLHADPAFQARVKGMFEGDFKLNFHLAPPLLSRRNEKGELLKQKYGPAMLTGFKWLARLKGLRGGAFDVFGKTHERREERALITEYRASLDEIIASLSLQNHAVAVDVARIPELIKGYGHVKSRHLVAARGKWESLMQEFRAKGRGNPDF
jgi:indolepyruvate ferredoxin oxidoreductase